MTEDRDPLLQSLFAEAQEDLDGEAFTALVMTQTSSVKHRFMFAGLCLLVVLASSAWLFALPLQVLAVTISQGLAVELVSLGGGWLAWTLSPVNNIAGLLVLLTKLLRMAWKRTLSASYGY